MTTLIGRATAYLRAEARDPGLLGTAIATLAVVPIAGGDEFAEGENNSKNGTSAGGAVGRSGIWRWDRHQCRRDARTHNGRSR